MYTVLHAAWTPGALMICQWSGKVKTHTSGVSSSFPWQSGGSANCLSWGRLCRLGNEPLGIDHQFLNFDASNLVVSIGPSSMIWGYPHDSGNLHLDQIEFSKNTLGAHGQFQYLSAETLMETPLRPIFKIEKKRYGNQWYHGFAIVHCWFWIQQMRKNHKTQHYFEEVTKSRKMQGSIFSAKTSRVKPSQIGWFPHPAGNIFQRTYKITMSHIPHIPRISTLSVFTWKLQ